jgi:hypothetical protein
MVLSPYLMGLTFFQTSLLAWGMSIAWIPIFITVLMQAEVPAPPVTRVAILVPVAEQVTWMDDAFLAAIPAAAVLGNGEPIVLAVSVKDPWRPELLDFLNRFEAQRLLWLGPEPTHIPTTLKSLLEALPARTAAEAAVALGSKVWAESKRVVLFDPADRSAALSASALAARLGVPLIPCPAGKPQASVLAWINTLGCKHGLYVGAGRKPSFGDLRIQHLKSAEKVTEFLVRSGVEVNYLAVVNPLESVAGRERHLTLAAPLLAAGRSGVVVPLAYQTRWKIHFSAEETLEKAPKGTAPSTNGWRRGMLLQGDVSKTFVTGQSPADGAWWMQVDHNGDGKFKGVSEQPIRTAGDLEFQGRTWTVDLHAKEKNNGAAVWLTTPTAAQVHSDLQGFHTAAQDKAHYLCMIGWPEALPMAIIGSGQGIDADLVSDLPFAQTDADPFVELGLARFIAEDLPSATLLACRGLARDDMPNQDWAKRFVTAEWEGVCRPALERAGLDFSGHHAGGGPFDAASPLAEAGLIMHASHAAWTVLGATYAWNSNTLLAPALVDSAGCSTASLDQDPEHRSVAARLLRNGAVAFVGNTRRGIAQQILFRSEFMNALLAGATIGDAQRNALNRVTLAVLENGEAAGGARYYQLYNHAVYGDPALQVGLRQGTSDFSATFEQSGKRVTVHAPKKWHRFEYEPLKEWGCQFPKLYTWRGAGVGVESTWFNAEKRDQETWFINVEARTRSRANSVELTTDVSGNLGWSGSCFIDEHQDGSRSLYWRVRMLDADMTSGEIRAQVDRLDFRLIRE